MSHKPNLLSWDQDVAASPREFHETDNNRTNSAALLATWQYFSFRHIWFSKLLSHQKLSKLFFPIFQLLCHSSKAKEVSRSPENYHLLQKWRTRKLPAILKNIDVWRDVTLVVMSRPMFTLETPPPSWSNPILSNLSYLDPGILLVHYYLLKFHTQFTWAWKMKYITIISIDRASKEKKVCLQRSSQFVPKKLQSWKLA